MTEQEIIKQAKRHFGKDRTYKKDFVLTYASIAKISRQWKKELRQIISNPYQVQYKLFDDVIQLMEDKQSDKIDWTDIGDLSWTIEVVLNPGINKGYDWDKKLASKCGGKARILKVFMSDVIPCYTLDMYEMTYNKEKNYYEFGPMLKPTKDEKIIIKKIESLLKKKGLQFVGKALCERTFKALYSDLHADGNASLFDVLFSDIHFYQTEIKRFSDKLIHEKNGSKFRWTELYHKKGVLKERIESRWISSGDYLKLVLDPKGQITQVEVTRKAIENKKHQTFQLNIVDSFKKQQKKEN